MDILNYLQGMAVQHGPSGHEAEVSGWLKARFEALCDLSLIHISEPTRQAEISYAVFCLKKKKKKKKIKASEYHTYT